MDCGVNSSCILCKRKEREDVENPHTINGSCYPEYKTALSATRK